LKKNEECGFHCIKANGISVTIGNDEILKDVNLHIHCKELTVLIGRNGAGKSTLLKAILGEVKHTGTISFEVKEGRTLCLRKFFFEAKSPPTSIKNRLCTTKYKYRKTHANNSL